MNTVTANTARINCPWCRQKCGGSEKEWGEVVAEVREGAVNNSQRGICRGACPPFHIE